MKEIKKPITKPWCDCLIANCSFKICLRLSNMFCYKHALVADPDKIVDAIIELNEQVSELKEKINGKRT